MRDDPSEKTGIVLQIEEKGESFWSVAFFSGESGLEYFLFRRSKRKSRPDLFDTAQVRFGLPKQAGPRFAEDYRVLLRRTAIGKSFSRVRIASRFANVLRKNGQHLAEPAAILPICDRFFNAVSEGVDLSASYLKALYLFASTEGLPLKEDWAGSLPALSVKDLGEVLKTPLGEQRLSEEKIFALSRSLENWLTGEAHFFIDP